MRMGLNKILRDTAWQSTHVPFVALFDSDRNELILRLLLVVFFIEPMALIDGGFALLIDHLGVNQLSARVYQAFVPD